MSTRPSLNRNLAKWAFTAGVIATAFMVPSQAQTDPPAADQEITYTLKDLGIRTDLRLLGVDGVYSIPLAVPQNLDATSATLHLKYRHSEALLAHLSHINVRLDGRHITTVLTDPDLAEQLQTQTITLPAARLNPNSALSFQLIGHYTTDCENPRYAGLWAEISNDTSLQLAVTPKTANSYLDDLPEPFFNRRSPDRLTLPFILPTGPDTTVLEAAGIVSSWFGALADYRGAQFPVLNNALPPVGNGVVFLNAENPFSSLELPELNGPQIAVVTHPLDSGSQLLVIRGRDNNEMKLAAQALVLGDKGLTGQVATITALTIPEPRKPYDAPRWVPGEKPVAFGQLQGLGPLQVQGFDPDLIRVGLRLPPDLYDPDGTGIPVSLRYHYTPRPKSHTAQLMASVNGVALETIDLDRADNPASIWNQTRNALAPKQKLAWHEASLSLPIKTMPANAELAFYFHYDYLSRGNCKDLPADTVVGRIDAQSTLDISHLPHFIALPDIAVFANSGFPFSRMADLSETAVMLPAKPGIEEQSTYLALLGRIGASTGYPATRIKVALAPQPATLADKDVLVIAGSSLQDTLGDWAKHVAIDSATSAVLAGFESPISSGRSVVVLAAKQPSQLHFVTEALFDANRIKDVRGTSVGFNAQSVHTLKNQPQYHVGNLSPPRRVVAYFTQHPLLLAAMGLIAVCALGVLMYVVMRARALQRLQE